MVMRRAGLTLGLVAGFCTHLLCAGSSAAQQEDPPGIVRPDDPAAVELIKDRAWIKAPPGWKKVLRSGYSIYLEAESGNRRTCSARVIEVPNLKGADQQKLNEIMGKRTRESTAQSIGANIGPFVNSVGSSGVAGVEFVASDGGVSTWVRQFMIADGPTGKSLQLDCTGPNPLSLDDRKSMAPFILSLKIKRAAP
jgi:hypothetical protein